MKFFSEILVALVALIHFYILWLEMFAWNTQARKTFRSFPADLFEKTRTMAGNQGLYNGFLAAGLVWSLLIGDPEWSRNVALFFLVCIAVAGLYGAVTVQKTILFVQTVPATLAIVLVLLR